MLDSYSLARDELFTQLSTCLPGVQTLLGYAPKIVYQGVESGVKMPTGKLWMRVSQQTVLESQDTLRADYGSLQKQRYETIGLLFVQIFVPKADNQNYAFGLGVADLVKKAYRGKHTENCIWFRNVRIQELPVEDAWFRLNVVAEYEYNEIG